MTTIRDAGLFGLGLWVLLTLYVYALAYMENRRAPLTVSDGVSRPVPARTAWKASDFNFLWITIGVAALAAAYLTRVPL